MTNVRGDFSGAPIKGTQGVRGASGPAKPEEAPPQESAKQAKGLEGDARQGGPKGNSSEISIEDMVQETLKDGPKGVVGEALDFWNDLGKSEGVKGVVGKAMAGLLEFSGLPDVERSAAELGARVGAGDSAGNIAKTGGKLAFHSGIVMLNGFAGGKAVTGLMAGKNAAAALPTVVRHYTNAETAAKIMQSGEIWASKAGNAGFNKVYLLAEEGANKGMNFLRRLNIGYGEAGKTAKAIEIDLTKLPPEVVKNFQRELASGPLNLEKFMTHQGNFNFNQFRDAVKVVDTQQMAVTMDQLAKTGAAVAKVGVATHDLKQGVQGALNAE